MLTLCLLLSIATTAGSYQATPDLSGRWVLVDAATTPASIPRELDVSLSHQKPVPVLTVARHMIGSVRTDIYQIGMVGGTVSMAAKVTDLTTHTRRSAKWEGQSFVIEEGKSYSGGSGPTPPGEHMKEVWSLDSTGALVIVVTEGSSERIVKYRRKPAGVNVRVA